VVLIALTGGISLDNFMYVLAKRTPSNLQEFMDMPERFRNAEDTMGRGGIVTKIRRGMRPGQ
jgi:hypothetical protein